MRLFVLRTRTKRTRLTLVCLISPTGAWFARQVVCPRYGTIVGGSGVSAPVRQGTTAPGESDSVSSPDAKRASSTMFVEAEVVVGASKYKDELVLESADMGSGQGLLQAGLKQAASLRAGDRARLR
ncbi:hypothetical protein DFH08DRAFT_137871 [Mycena albidolilacea]|uniref:Uncharacterized protein n=1 Tax=Mycena albidolilacea TaxID=1033008 RepID=A0AAD7ESE4_9AGAR|nr:hypothetical protein DFH08DRAFT_137871 [Mycena albidolilacea]